MLTSWCDGTGVQNECAYNAVMKKEADVKDLENCNGEFEPNPKNDTACQYKFKIE